jgi:hypothetical protein
VTNSYIRLRSNLSLDLSVGCMSCLFSSLGGKLLFIEDEAWLKREMKMALSNFDPIEKKKSLL